MTLGKKIAKLREALRDCPSQRKVGFDVFGEHLTGYSVQSKMARIEGDIQEPTVSDLKKLANYFDVSIYYLLGLTEAEEMNDVRKRLKEKPFPGSSGKTAGIKQKAI